jgi:hypothetical protein
VARDFRVIITLFGAAAHVIITGLMEVFGFSSLGENCFCGRR